VKSNPLDLSEIKNSLLDILVPQYETFCKTKEVFENYQTILEQQPSIIQLSHRFRL
jgi:hypothetical protein